LDFSFCSEHHIYLTYWISCSSSTGSYGGCTIFCSGLIFTKGVSPISQPAPVGEGIKQRPTAPHRQTKEL